MNNFFFIVYLLVIAQFTFSQDAQLAETFFNDNEIATARSLGMAGAFGSVGADFSNATNNPAGIGFFRKKELALNVGYNSTKFESNYYNNNQSTTVSNLDINNIAYAYTNMQYYYKNDSLQVRKQGLVSWTLIAGLNKKASLTEELQYEAYNNNSSLLTAYTRAANQIGNVSDLNFFERQAYDVGLLEFNGSSFTSETLGGNVQQEGLIEREGSRRNYYLAGGVNYSNQLYLGATISVPTVNYETNRSYLETDTNDIFSNFKQLNLQSNSEYSSSGLVGNLGAIYRINDYFRLGASFKTPSVLEVKESSVLSLDASYKTTNRQTTSENFSSTYNLTLPLKAGLQFTALNPNYGLISIEGEYVNYGSTRLKYNSGDDDLYVESFRDAEQQFKNQINETYDGAFNIRVGGEARVLRDIRLRGGYSFYQSPYKTKELELGNDYAKQTLALGFGYRIIPLNTSIDLGWNRTTNSEYNYDYYIPTANIANNIDSDRTKSLIVLGISKRFNR